MKNIPKKIYLQVDSENEKPEDFKELREVTWCEDRINDSDIEYVKKDLEALAQFKRIIRNYLKMKIIKNRE